MFIELFLFTLTVVLIFVYFCGKYNERYWTKRGVTFHKNNKFLGPFYDFITGERALFEVLGDLYKEYDKEPVVGIGSILTPSLFIRDATNISHILQTDFNAFSHRGLEPFEGDPLSESVLFLNGPKWKLMRQNMTPLFTTTKLKNMYYIMDKGAQDFVKHMKQHPELLKGNAFDTLTNYCCAALVASIFGIGTKSIFESPFITVARQAVKPSLKMNLKFSLSNLSPWLTKFLGIKIFAEFEDFFVGSMKHVLEQREKENEKRHDFADLAVNIQKGGTMKDPTTGCEMEPTVGLLSAQAFFFFIAGVEPSTTAMFCTLFELGSNPEILQKVHEEIDEAFDTHKDLNYDIVSDMLYLEKVLSESMRKFPPIGYLTRKCVSDTVLPVGNIKVDKGTKVFTPIWHIHHDPKFYPEPEVFDPERFSKDGQQQLSDTFFMPFGRGGRICIGARFARLQVKAGLVHLLRHFTPKTIESGPIKFKKEQIAVRPVNIDVAFIPRNIKQ